MHASQYVHYYNSLYTCVILLAENPATIVITTSAAPGLNRLLAHSSIARPTATTTTTTKSYYSVPGNAPSTDSPFTANTAQSNSFLARNSGFTAGSLVTNIVQSSNTTGAIGANGNDKYRKRPAPTITTPETPPSPRKVRLSQKYTAP